MTRGRLAAAALLATTIGCEIYVERQVPAAPARRAPPPPTAAQPAPGPQAAATAPPAPAPVDPPPAKPAKVIPMHVRGGVAPASTPGSPPAPAGPAPVCLDSAAAPSADCATLGAPASTCAASSTAKQRCGAYQANLNPKVATAAVYCMSSLTGAQLCDSSQIDTCVQTALGKACADSTVSQLCGIAAGTCKTTASDCSALLSGLNDQGKQQVAQCVGQGCTGGLPACVQALH